ncbi:hypothetical protein JGK43_003460 [Edwardsiella piscicida]|nr:hypothetical protein [Edwardsiella piscicida]ELM3730543.1 hypothetical protein [Edwardsiella piscicida]ELV7537970.1 hypothetical protein [Edwardsiella piscicida]
MSRFDLAINRLDTRINTAMSCRYDLVLKSGSILTVDAIWDSTQQEAKSGAVSNHPRFLRAVSEHGVLTVLQQRLVRDDVMGAAVETPHGPRWVVDLDYPDATATVLLLGISGDTPLPTTPGVRFTKKTV